MSSKPIGKPRPLWSVILLSGATLLLYYGYYKWMIQDELRRYTGSGFSGAVALLPFVLGVAVPQALRLWDPDVPNGFGWVSLVGIVWIYIVQFRLYCTVNRLYREAGMKEPLVVWWLFVPGLNLLVGLQQIHFLSQFWAKQQGIKTIDPIAQALPILFASLFMTIGCSWTVMEPAIGLPMSSLSLSSPPIMGSIFSFAGTPPSNLGWQNDSFAPCPQTPNCVNSLSQDSTHTIAPLPLTSAPATAFEKLKAIVTDLPRTKIITATDNYLYAEFTSALMGFVDDVEFYLDSANNVIQVRSASRLGESDLGVNRQRIETIRAKLSDA